MSDVEFDREPGGGVPPGELETKQPSGLWVLFITEMWERFSYYGMRALLVLYLIASTQTEIENSEGEMVANLNPGFGWTEANAAILYAIYTWAVYLTPIFGGWIGGQVSWHPSLDVVGRLDHRRRAYHAGRYRVVRSHRRPSCHSAVKSRGSDHLHHRPCC